jgi:hypothetical protein
MSAEFSVYQFFLDKTWERVAEFVEVRTAVETAMRLTKTLGARLGMTVCVIITDGDDYTVFEWRRTEGITFPPALAARNPPPLAPKRRR